MTKTYNFIVAGMLLGLLLTGCRKSPTSLTALPPGRMPDPNEYNNNLAGANGITNSSESNSLLKDPNYSGTPLVDPALRQNWPRDSKIFEQYTVHFDYDRAVVKSGEKAKVTAVSDYLKANPATALEVDGHADERGTEEYNRALGERRALSLREELIKLGIEAARIDTVSFGKDKPVDTGHTDAAHSRNRRGEFLLETPPK